MERVAKDLARMEPSLVEHEDFLFALAWARYQHRQWDDLRHMSRTDRLRGDPTFKYDFAYYMQQFPNGKYAAIARSQNP